MKITDKRHDSNSVKIEDLAAGDTFVFSASPDCDVYLMVRNSFGNNGLTLRSVEVFNISVNHLTTLNTEDKVTKVKAELVVKDG